MADSFENLNYAIPNREFQALTSDLGFRTRINISEMLDEKTLSGTRITIGCKEPDTGDLNSRDYLSIELQYQRLMFRFVYHGIT
ncbi:hypothetical protein CEXT_633421 [Caerostris extrusa]|uniref:Uncharacterized protein n=1 Tax=Caerostris extrusa TaxID=172846 RepID=A0AAV4T2S2_CAEEX|nr:hypothetical protein CEXT_633421 [Caerostris extrusa]